MTNPPSPIERVRNRQITKKIMSHLSKPDTQKRFWSKVEQSGKCWNWTGNLNNGGYGVFSLLRSNWGVHRLSYHLLVGKFPAHLTIDHLCRNRRCLNPKHLEPVTLKENCLRGIGPTALNAKKKTCALGHPYVGDNLRVSKRGYRCCIKCQAIWDTKWYKRKKVHSTRKNGKWTTK